MLKQYLSIFALVSLGLAIGYYLSASRQSPQRASLPATTLQIHQTNTEQTEQLQALQTQIAQLKERIESLEQDQVAVLTPELPEVIEPSLPPQQQANQTATIANTTLDGLIAAGLDALTAEQIVRDQSQAELRRLELRDRAIREGFITDPQYREELQKLREQEVAVREQIDEEMYDRYLYHTGQPNRLSIDSVILGSAAEQSGLQAGDIVLRYEDRRLYNGNDLRSATVEGERDELVAVTVIREGSEMTVSIPRGPMGIRINSVRHDPDQG